MNHLKSFFAFSRLSEGNDLDDLDDLISGFQNLGINMTEEEIQMQKFVRQFGIDMDPNEWAEYLFDTITNHLIMILKKILNITSRFANFTRIQSTPTRGLIYKDQV